MCERIQGNSLLTISIKPALCVYQTRNAICFCGLSSLWQYYVCAHGHHTKKEKLAVSVIQSKLSLLILQLVTLDDLSTLKNPMASLWQKVFQARLYIMSKQ